MSKQDVEDINSGDESDHDLISEEMLEDSELDSPKGVNSCENLFYNSQKYLV